MQFKNIEAFEKEVREKAPSFSPVYLFLMEDPFERIFYRQKLFAFIRHYKSALTLEKKNFDAADLEGDFGAGLFVEERMLVIDIGEKCKESDASRIKEVIFAKASQDILVLTGADVPSTLISLVDKMGTTLSLLEEKPWDKSKRYALEVGKLAKAQGKVISPEMATFFVERIGLDLALLKNEIEKVSVFIHPQKEIDEASICKITIETRGQNFWNIASDAVFGEKITEMPKLTDISDFLAILGQVRFYIMMAIEVGEQIEKGLPPSHKNLKKAHEKKIIPFIQKKGTQFFINALLYAFELEQMAKSKTIDPLALWESFMIHSSHDPLLVT